MEKKFLNVNTIYPAFMGEVNYFGIGAPCTFIRLSGCNLRCYKKTMGILCDTPEALEASSGIKMSIDDIVTRALSFGRRLICLTGGEPLIHDGVKGLVEQLTNWGFSIVIETNGSVDVSEYLDMDNVHLVVDCKGMSSGESDKMIVPYNTLRKCDFVKFVINDFNDYLEFKGWYIKEQNRLSCNVATGLFWGSTMTYMELYQRLDLDQFLRVYVNMQVHKMGCLYDNRKDSLDGILIPRKI